MPELPEVQTIVDDLNKKIKGYKIVDFWTEWKKSVKMPLDKFRKEIINRKIKEINRRGKNIIIHLSDSKVILVHLKMTGHLLIKSKVKRQKSKFFNEKVNQYIRHVWLLKKNKKCLTLEFSDLRKFGKIRLIDENDLTKDKELSKLGIEPFSKEFNLKKLKEIFLKKSKTTVRNILMDQQLISGVGNIYASEIMFEAGILPKRLTQTLSEKEFKNLYVAIIKILKKAVKTRGTSDSDYRDTDGAPGGFQNFLKVYNREGEKCKIKNCKGIVKRVKINQRSAYYCELCQK